MIIDLIEVFQSEHFIHVSSLHKTESLSLTHMHASTHTHIHMCIRLFCDIKYTYNDINTHNIVSEAVRLLIVMNKAV